MPQLTRRPRRTLGEERGFTLPEVLTTIVLLGILFGIATSTWFELVESRRVDSATNQVAADLRLAHNSAGNRLTEYRVAYVPGGQINCAGSSAIDPDPEARPDYCLLRKTGSSYEQTKRFLPQGTAVSSGGLEVDAIVSTLLGSANTRTLKFNANGTVESGGGLSLGASDIRVTVASDDGSPSHILDAHPATSRIKIDP